MNLYRWQSTLLQQYVDEQYADGAILVQADTVDNAHRLVREAFNDWMEANRDWVLWKAKQGDSESYNREYQKLLDDLSKEPEIITGVLWLTGSA